MRETIRCPYGVERGQFMPMSARSDGNWFVCDRCGHLVLPRESNVQMHLRTLRAHRGSAKPPKIDLD
jgi:hypothetical protein